MNRNLRPRQPDVRAPLSKLRTRLHWVVAMLVLLQYIVHDAMVATMRAIRLGQTPDVLDYLLSNVHLLTGIAIGLLMAWRLWLRLQDKEGRDTAVCEAGSASDAAPGVKVNTAADAVDLRNGAERSLARSDAVSSPAGMDTVLTSLATLVHWVFYALLLLLPLSGLIAYYDIEFAATLHRSAQRVLLFVLGLHVVAALYHHVWRRDKVLTRMFGGD